MDIKPFGRRIYVKPEERQSIFKTDQKLFIEKAEVIAVGSEVGKHKGLLGLLGLKKKNRIRIGDKILLTPWGTDHFQEHYFILETDEFILGHVGGE